MNATGIEFTVHSFRRTSGQLLVDKETNISIVSKMLGHSSSVVTEKYYCGESEDRATAAVLKAFARPNPMVYGANSGDINLISKEYGNTGYAKRRFT